MQARHARDRRGARRPRPVRGHRAGARSRAAASRSRRGRSCTRRCERLLARGAARAAYPSPRAAICILLAPPLVIAERELADALDLLDRSARRTRPPGAMPMSFKLTYATMFSPPEELHDTLRGRHDPRPGHARRAITRCTSPAKSAARASSCAPSNPARPRARARCSSPRPAPPMPTRRCVAAHRRLAAAGGAPRRRERARAAAHVSASSSRSASTTSPRR